MLGYKSRLCNRDPSFSPSKDRWVQVQHIQSGFDKIFDVKSNKQQALSQERKFFKITFNKENNVLPNLYCNNINNSNNNNSNELNFSNANSISTMPFDKSLTSRIRSIHTEEKKKIKHLYKDYDGIFRDGKTIFKRNNRIFDNRENIKTQSTFHTALIKKMEKDNLRIRKVNPSKLDQEELDKVYNRFSTMKKKLTFIKCVSDFAYSKTIKFKNKMSNLLNESESLDEKPFLNPSQKEKEKKKKEEKHLKKLLLNTITIEHKKPKLDNIKIINNLNIKGKGKNILFLNYQNITKKEEKKPKKEDIDKDRDVTPVKLISNLNKIETVFEENYTENFTESNK